VLALVLLAQVAASGARPQPTPVPSSQRVGSISERAGGMKVNSKAFDGFGDPPPPKEKPTLSGGSPPKKGSAQKTPAPPKGKKPTPTPTP